MKNKIQKFINSDFFDRLRNRCLFQEKLSMEVSYTEDTVKITIGKMVEKVKISETLEMTDKAIGDAPRHVNTMFDRFYNKEQRILKTINV